MKNYSAKSTRGYHAVRTQAKLKKQLRRITIETIAGCTMIVMGFLVFTAIMYKLLMMAI